MKGLSRRELLVGTASIPAAAIIPMRSAAAQELAGVERELYEAAKAEGEITWYSGQYNAETSEARERAETVLWSSTNGMTPAKRSWRASIARTSASVIWSSSVRETPEVTVPSYPAHTRCEPTPSI